MFIMQCMIAYYEHCNKAIKNTHNTKLESIVLFFDLVAHQKYNLKLSINRDVLRFNEIT